MAVGALIGAYQEDDSGGLRALLPLAGRTLVEYQARCAAAAGASPIVVLVERIPLALNQAFDRLQREGVPIVAVSDGVEAAGRFEPGERVILIGDGVAPPVDQLVRLAEEQEAAVVTVPDDDQHRAYERIDATSRWSGLALVDGRTIGATAAMLGDWDLQSTLLRRSIQQGALTIPIASDGAKPLLAENSEQLADFERGLIAASRTARRDAASRYLLPFAEEIAVEKLMDSRVRPGSLLILALALTLGAALAFTRGWLWPALLMLIVASPIDIVAERLATLRLRPLSPRSTLRRLLWPASGLALVALGWWETRYGAGWGALVAALTAAAFAEAGRLERPNGEIPGRPWLLSRRNAIFLAVPFALAGAWTAYLLTLAAYAAGSFFYLQHLRHRVGRD